MSYSMQEKSGIIDLLQTERNNVSILYQLAKSVTKNVINADSEQDALDTIFLHIPDCNTLLNKRLITKEILIKYLHKKKVPLTADFTKAQLIKKVIDYWHHKNASSIANDEITRLTNNPPPEVPKTNGNSTTTVTEFSEFPIHLLARQFTEWFFNNYNKETLKVNDFWSDAKMILEIAANDAIDERMCYDAQTLLQTLTETKQLFGFYFNPNLTHAGVQGRMDVHGLVLVLACGTLHTTEDCVGVFESVFGLLRDPFAENNWKTKNVKIILRSKGAPAMPSLEDSEALREALELPVPEGELS